MLCIYSLIIQLCQGFLCLYMFTWCFLPVIAAKGGTVKYYMKKCTIVALIFFNASIWSISSNHMWQGSRVRPNFSRVRLTKIPGRTGASSHSRKKKKYPRLRNSTKDTPVRLISWSKPIRDSEGRTPPLIGRGPDIPVCVCARWQMRHVCCCSQTERKRWVVEMRAVLPT